MNSYNKKNKKKDHLQLNLKKKKKKKLHNEDHETSQAVRTVAPIQKE